MEMIFGENMIILDYLLFVICGLDWNDMNETVSDKMGNRFVFCVLYFLYICFVYFTFFLFSVYLMFLFVCVFFAAKNVFQKLFYFLHTKEK